MRSSKRVHVLDLDSGLPQGNNKRVKEGVLTRQAFEDRSGKRQKTMWLNGSNDGRAQSRFSWKSPSDPANLELLKSQVPWKLEVEMPHNPRMPGNHKTGDKEMVVSCDAREDTGKSHHYAVFNLQEDGDLTIKLLRKWYVVSPSKTNSSSAAPSMPVKKPLRKALPDEPEEEEPEEPAQPEQEPTPLDYSDNDSNRDSEPEIAEEDSTSASESEPEENLAASSSSSSSSSDEEEKEVPKKPVIRPKPVEEEVVIKKVAIPKGLITADELVEYLTHSPATSVNIGRRFASRLKENEENKRLLATLLKQVAEQKSDGKYHLKK